MSALAGCAQLPVDQVSAAVFAQGTVRDTFGDIHHVFPVASISKMCAGWATLIAVQEGILTLDDPAGQTGCTVRHLLAHAGGYSLDERDPIAPPARRRMYSNRSIEIVADTLAVAAGMPYATYLTDAVIDPLGMSATELRGSAAHGLCTTVADLGTFVGELMQPRLVDSSLAAQYATVQFPDLAGIVPGFGRFDPCPWGLGCEVRGSKSPHWTGTRNSPLTFGHYGGSGTMLWVDPAVGAACVILTDRPFLEWSAEASRMWPAISDAVVDSFHPTTPVAGH